MNEEEAKSRLFDWGDWVRKHGDIGWSSENIIAKMMRDSEGAGHVTGGSYEIFMPEPVQEVEDAVLMMLIYFKEGKNGTDKARKIEKAIKVKYIAQPPDIEGHKQCKCSYPEYRNRVKMGTLYVAGRLSKKIA